MKKQISTGLGIVAVAAVGAVLLPSCSKSQPAPTTTVIVQAPAAPTSKGDSNSDKDEIADLRNSDDVSAQKPAAAKPTERDVEDSVPAKKSSSKAVSSSKSKSQLMDFYDRLPSKHFTMFQNGNRRALLKRKGTIVDYRKNYIEIPGSADPADGDLESLQITLFPNGDEPWCAVSRIVWPGGQTPGSLDFYYDSAEGLRKAAEGFFPYELEKTRDGYESAFLPRKGLDIVVTIPGDAERRGYKFHYNRNFRVGEPAFTPVLESQ